eukprot:m.25094 g.25094  ORF g.25094 m.25094 type:complete len:915 (+) comp7676_c0_seq1:317-3061(+)
MGEPRRLTFSPGTDAIRKLELRQPHYHLCVTVVSGIGLRKTDVFGTPDPFVKISLLGETYSSKPVKKTLSPVWNQPFHFKQAKKDGVLKVSIWNWRKFTKKSNTGFMGECDISLSFLPEIAATQTSKCDSYQLHLHGGESCGNVFINFDILQASSSPRRMAQRSESVSVPSPVAIVAGSAMSSPRRAASSGLRRGGSVGLASESPPSPAVSATSKSNVTNTPPQRPRSRTAGSDPRLQGGRPSPARSSDSTSYGTPPRSRGSNASRKSRTSSTTVAPAPGAMATAITKAKLSKNIIKALQAPLPAGWEARLTANGKIYYANHVSKRTQWHRPTTAAGAETTSARAQEREDYERRSLLATGAMESGNSAQQEDEEQFGFPPGSPPRERRTESGQQQQRQQASGSRQSSSSASGDARRSSSQQQRQQQNAPRSSAGAHRASYTQSQRLSNPFEKDWRDYIIDEDLGDFPVGWEQRRTPAGVPYFVDHVNRTTTFEDPRVADREERRRQAIQHEASLPQYKRDLRKKLLRLRDLFRSQLRQRERALAANATSAKPAPQLKVEIAVSRDAVFEDSYMVLMKLKPEQLEGKLHITFFGEDALDYGGVSREWFFSLSREMLNPYYGLFQPAGGDQYLLQINAASGVNPSHLAYFQFVGRVIGLAVKHAQYLEGGFIMPIYKLLLGKGVSLDDMAQVDPTYHSSLMWMLENDITDVIENTFTDEQEVFGVIKQVELMPGGAKIEVTEKNKLDYVRRIVRHRLLNGVEQQVMALKRGFNEVVPRTFMDMFDECELELIVCGLGEISVNDWKKNTEYRNCTESDTVIKWWWKTVEKMGSEERARLLQFVTGTSRVPVTGFRDLQGSTGNKKFTIEIVDSMDPKSLPKSHTCFNRIDMPKYNSYNDLNSKLVLAIENTMGFGIE